MIAAKIVPLGNSLGVRLPKTFLESMGINAKDAAIAIDLVEDAIIIRKQENAQPRKSFEQLMETYYGKPFDQIDAYIESPEVDWGDKAGDEVW